MGMDRRTEASRVVGAAEAFLASVVDFDPGAVSVPACVRVADLAARVEKAASCLRVLAASRAVACGAHKTQGVPDPVSWVARQGGTTGSDARKALELARSLEHHPMTKEALLQGAVSVAQAQEITRAAAELPGQEQELLEVARAGDLRRLRDETRRLLVTSMHRDDLHRRQLAARRFRHWKDALGMVCFEGALPPETGIPLVGRIEREAARRAREARRTGRTERFEAHAADALLGLDPASGARRGRTDLVIVCDLYAWRRGHVHEGEVCQLLGAGPIPLGLAKELSKDAFLKCVLHDGVDIQRIRHVGRKYTAELRTALDLGPVPSFSGRACVDCGRTFGLQDDHTDPVAHTGPTTVANVKPRCYPCHQEKTERDRRAGLLGKRAKQRGPGAPAAARNAGARRTPRQAPRRAPPSPGPP